MKNDEIIKIAMQQSAVDSHCCFEDFMKTENKIVISGKNPNARKYLELPFYCDLTSYGNNIVASVSEELLETVSEYIGKYPIEHCFETPNLHMLMEKLKPFNLNVCFMAEYFLPDLNYINPLECKYETRVMGPEQFSDCYVPEWQNALSKNRKQLDKLAVGAFDNGKLIGLAGCSADCETMWQIGVDVLTEYRKRGIASSLTSKLAVEVLKRNIVPFYCCAWSNIKSVRNAIKSGFRPAWVQVTVKSNEYITDMNK
ncbi:GNAT family N-acetyltransferase [Anaerocolumna sedimenticola]|uniref:GNAT family N-acetyltransferase n=1 Tax=Anaerocolumna sedimenticola TaxID=2696063 RepID=A0A6P1TIU7_9FIRM|nr:GNAT family N-acetyltransferase [Anaerocolumna sedimenticola]QHQ59555.1 GNAT family N-acetyltransferase [Anaerocolumna sedimenticola]